MTQRENLVTHALPYANGPLHIGHLLGYIQSDMWVRARRMAYPARMQPGVGARGILTVGASDTSVGRRVIFCS